MDPMRQRYRELSDREVAQMKELKARGEALFDYINQLPTTRESSIAKTKVEEALLWATKGLTG